MERTKDKKWKFINHDGGWWLKLESPEEVIEYLELTGHKFGDAALNLALNLNNKNENKYEIGSLEYHMDAFNRIHGGTLFGNAISMGHMAGKAYLDHIYDDGFVYINCVGGCNSCDWTEHMIEYREKIIFPNYTKKDIKITTFKPIENTYACFREDDYNYHYYAYIGDVQIRDGDKLKWDTEEEARAFAEKLVD